MPVREVEQQALLRRVTRGVTGGYEKPATSSGRAHRVWSKRSCGLPVIEFQQASQTLAGVDLSSGFTDPVHCSRKEDHVLLTLVVPFRVVMREVISQAMPQRALPEQDHFRQHFGFH